MGVPRSSIVPAARSNRAAWGLRNVLLLGMLVPLLGAILNAGIVIRDRSATSSASAELEDAAADLAVQARFVAALTAEEVHSSMVALADADPALGVDTRLTRARLAGARALVDSSTFAQLRADLGVDAQRRLLRERLDRGDARHREVRRLSAQLHASLDRSWAQATARLDRIADREPLPADLRVGLRSLRSSMDALAHARDRSDATLATFLGAPTARRTEALIDATARFRSAAAVAQASAGPQAAERWSRLASDPAASRTEAAMAQAVRVGLAGRGPLRDIDPATLAGHTADCAAWAVLLTDVVRAAAADLQGSASDRAAAAARSMATETAGVSVLVLVSVAVAVLIARSISRPVARLEGAARTIRAGQFDLEPLDDRGPRELVATVRAFNEMSATLAAVEAHAVALAEDPASTALDEPLPGRTGQAMQTAIDRLRTSISDAEAHRAELTQLARRDDLTGLLNRAGAWEALERDLARARRDGTALLALFIDLDGLKQLNDVHGHACGDEAIRRTAAALRSSTREGDVVARLGGDEFVVVGPLPPDGRAGGDLFARRVRDAVRGQAVAVADGTQVPLRCSVGAAVSGPGTPGVDELIAAADLALYRAKGAGRDRVAWSEEAVASA